MHCISRMILAAFCLAPFALAGCGGNSVTNIEDGAQQARKEKTVTPEELLQGQWQGTMVLHAEAEKQLPAAQVEQLRSMTMGMEFQTGGRLILVGGKENGQPDDSVAAWEVVAVKDNQITIKTIEASGKETDAVLMFENDDSFLMPLKTEVANLGAMRFERLR